MKERFMTAEEPGVDWILVAAAQAGLPLSEAEAAELVAGVVRLRGMAQTVRELLASGTEPAPVFSAGQERPS
jgi:hypothetical protein